MEESLPTKSDKVKERVVDSAESESIRHGLLVTGWTQRSLYSGDFAFFTYDYKKSGITRKTVTDLLSSIGSKRDIAKPNRRGKTFGQQLEEMLEYYDIKIILIEGSWRTVSPRRQILDSRGIAYFAWDMVWNFLRTWQDRGFTLELTTDEGHTIQRLNELYSYYQKPYHTGAVPHNVIGDNRILAFPVGCRGKTAMKVLEYFGNLTNIGNATYSELLTVDDVGPKRAESILLHFHRSTRKNVTDTESETP